MDFETSIEIDAPADRVWATLVDAERWPEWTASVRSLSYLGGGGLARGKQVRVRQPGMPALIWEVLDFDPGRSFTWRSASPGVTRLGTHRLAPVGSDRVTVTLGVHQAGPLAPIVALPGGSRFKRYVRLEAAALKRRCEAR